MKQVYILGAILFSFLLIASNATADVVQKPPILLPASDDLKLSDVKVAGVIEGENISFKLDFSAEAKKAEQEIVLVSGFVVLKDVEAPVKGYRLRYDAGQHRYMMEWPRKGTYNTSVTFVALPKIGRDKAWREASFNIPVSRMRELEITCDRTDLEVKFPGALRVTRTIKDDKLVMTAILGPGLPFAVRWRPKVAELDAALVINSEANTIATIRAGALGLDSLYIFDIAQGKLREVKFELPETLNVTQVRGQFVRDWRIDGTGADRQLTVALNRAQIKEYALQIVSEMSLPKFPNAFDLPVIKPKGAIRASGHLALGTNSAIHMIVDNAAGLSQTEVAGFPRIVLDRKRPRRLPAAKAFYYTYASTPYRVHLKLDDIVPSFDVLSRQVLNISEDDLVMEVALELDVRDAPLRDLVLEAPAYMVVASVNGREVEDHSVREGSADKPQQVGIHFAKPVLGRTLVNIRFEMGRSPLDELVSIEKFNVIGAKNERGYLVVVADPSVQLETPKATDLREVHTASVPMRVANAQFAYRYRQPGWTLGLMAKEKSAGLLAESFHTISISDGAVYGFVVVNYLISGAPVDEFAFRVPEGIENVEFIGGDVRRWFKTNGVWNVKLGRKVIGDYNLAISYSHPYKPGEPVTFGGIESVGMERRSGFICVTSRLDLNISDAEKADDSLLEIKTEEIPENYRLLLNAPVLRAYKYVAAPHQASLNVQLYDRGSVLPVVIELMDADTGLTITDAGATESVTRVRYKIKNASSQSLKLAMPQGVSVWSTKLIKKTVGSGEKATRLTASLDEKTGNLLIPLPRLRDPNEPITIELVFGQEHPELEGGGTLKLLAPRSDVESTFGLWRIHTPKDWAILTTDDGSMAPKQRAPEFHDLASVMLGVWRSWRSAFHNTLSRMIIMFVGGLIVLLALVGTFWKRGPLLKIALVFGVIALILIGLMAAATHDFRTFASPSPLTQIEYTRALTLDDASGMSVVARVVPSWRRHATLFGTVIIPIIGLLSLIAGLRNIEKRAVFYGVGGACLMFGAAHFPICGRIMAHFMTWGAPLALLLWLIPRVLAPIKPARILNAAALIALVCSLQGCAALGGNNMPEEMTVNRVEYKLSAEKDSMIVKMKMDVATPTPAQITLLPQSAILMSPDEISDDLVIVRHNGDYQLDIKKKGTYSVEIEFLSSLPVAGENQVRHFKIATPAALTNRVELKIPKKGVEVSAPTAVYFEKKENDSGLLANAIVAPGGDIEFYWKPRTRQRKLEETKFFAETLSLVRFDTGLVRGKHLVRFQIAQGELKDIRIGVPEGVTVTAVEGDNLGAWRFDPATREMEGRLTNAVSGEYALRLSTQITTDKASPIVKLGAISVLGAAHQRGVLGLTTSATVFVTPAPGGQVMNIDDFAREAAALFASDKTITKPTIRHAYRIQNSSEMIDVAVTEVRPEIRSEESATFTVSDERLVYNGEIHAKVSKAGVFSIDLTMPEGFDIDTLAAPEVSHWDEDSESGERIVHVHFRKKLFGSVALKIALSRPVSELPEEITVPRMQLAGSLKHAGRVTISSTRNVRLSIKERKGVSEFNAIELGIRQAGTLAFNLLRPEWTLTLKTEIVQPRINVNFLHVARVNDGLVRHTNYLRYKFYNAGRKVFNVRVPAGVLGLEITGSEIAHIEEVKPGSGIWQVELARKQFERPYLLKLRYDTQFERNVGEVVLEATEALDVDLQRGHLVVYATDRVAIAEAKLDEALQDFDPRGLPTVFGAGDLSDAALCYRAPAADYTMAVQATRHQAAPLLEATVQNTIIRTVISQRGEAITHVHMQMSVGSRRHLEARLPVGSNIWSLRVNQRSELPSIITRGGETVTLIPLEPSTSGELPVEIDLIYVTNTPQGWESKRQLHGGPRFDLPLQNVSWNLHLPEDFVYHDFESSLNVDEESVRVTRVQLYDINAYERAVSILNSDNNAKAIALQSKGEKLAQEGKQQLARQALFRANGYAYNDAELNEDTRVQLNSLMRQQAIVGLVNQRDLLRQKRGDYSQPNARPNLTAQFDQDEAQRLQNSLNREDSKNLELITKRLIEMQEESLQSRVQLMVSVPLRGRVIQMTRPLQVKANAEMSVSFRSKRETPARKNYNFVVAGILAVIFSLLVGADRAIKQRRVRIAGERQEALANAIAEISDEDDDAVL